jgi:hypothetical protein
MERATAIARAKEEKRADQVLDTTAGKGQELQSFEHQVAMYSFCLSFVKVYARLADNLIPVAVSASTACLGVMLIFSLAKGGTLSHPTVLQR